MKKEYPVISSQRARSELGSVLDRVFYTRQPIIIEQQRANKKRRTAIVPYELLEVLTRDEHLLIDDIESLSAQNKEVPLAEIEHSVDEVVRDVRKRKHEHQERHKSRL